MTLLYAQPYDIRREGFYFKSAQEYMHREVALQISSGSPRVELEIQFIDGKDIDAKLFKALDIHQGNVSLFLDSTKIWSPEEKTNVIIAVGEIGYTFKLGEDDPNQFDIDLYELDSLYELAVQFVEEGLYGKIPEHIGPYLNYDAIARDLGMEYSQIKINGTRYIYRCS